MTIKTIIQFACLGFTMALSLVTQGLAQEEIQNQTTSAVDSEKKVSQWPIGFPTVNATIPNAVPLADILRIADFEAQRTWGKVSSICKIPCCDQYGNIVAYKVVFLIHTLSESDQSTSDVSYVAIQSRIKEARRQYPSAERNYKNARLEMNRMINDTEKQHEKDRLQANAVNDLQNPILPEVMNIPATKSFKEAYAKMENLRNTMTGAGQYGTVLVSARYDLIPVPVVEHGLPPFHTRGDLMQKKAEESIGGIPMLKRIYLAGPLDQWYEFENAESENILVDPAKGKTYPQTEIHTLMKDGILMKGKPDTNTRKWETLKTAAKEALK